MLLLPMFTRDITIVYLRLHLFSIHLPLFTLVQLCLLVISYAYHCLLVFN